MPSASDRSSTTFTTRLSFDRSSLNPKDAATLASLKRARTNKPLCPGYSVSDMWLSACSPKVLLGRNSRERCASRQQLTEITIPLQQPSSIPAEISVKAPKHLDILEAKIKVAVRDSSSSRTRYSQSYNREESRRASRPVSRIQKRQSRGEISSSTETHSSRPASESLGHSAYHEYLAQAFGLPPVVEERTMVPKDTTRKPAHSARRKVENNVSSADISRISSPQERRPRIQVKIPERREQSYGSILQQMSKGGDKRCGRACSTPSTVSPPSTTTRQIIPSDISEARLSIVSPVSVVQMPRPRRHFSAKHFEGMTVDAPQSAPPMVDSTLSSSSDESGEHNEKLSDYSPRSSISSIDDVAVQIKPFNIHRRPSLAYSVLSPMEAGVFDSTRQQTPRNLNMAKSAMSVSKKARLNKPLPPEPGAMDIVPLNISGESLSRNGSMRARSRIPSPLDVAGKKASSHRSLSIKSKYTRTDFDALDAAFKKTSPQISHTSSFKYSTPSQSQVELALEAQLGTISEDAPLNSVAILHNPLQISRGPMHMEPSRKAPSPPGSIRITTDSVSSMRRKLQKRSASHLALLMRAGDKQDLTKHISAPMVGDSSDKAHVLLGKSQSPLPVAMEREVSSDSNLSASDLSRANSTDSNMSDSTHTPASDVSSIPGPMFEEIRKRLELLSPKGPPPNSFYAFHHGNASDVSIDLPIGEYSSRLPSRPNTAGKDGTVASGQLTESATAPQVTLDSNEPASAGSNQVPLFERRGRNGASSFRSLASLAVSEIPDIYASLPSSKSTIRLSIGVPSVTEEDLACLPTAIPVLTTEDAERSISAEIAETILYRIMLNLDNLQDLFSAAQVSRGFYRTFKRHELALMKNALFKMSPAAWELREICSPAPSDAECPSPKFDYTSSLYLGQYMRDMYTMIALKSMILVHCESFLRSDTITALAGGETERSSQIDDAFWRVWTFCRLFGCNTNRDEDIVAQMDWLRGGVIAKQFSQDSNSKTTVNGIDSGSILHNPPTGFGKGNANGLSAEELYDMIEVWTCLGVLVRGFQGKREEAREYGVFKQIDITSGDVEKEDAVLGKWT